LSTLITIDLDALTANYRACRDAVAPADCAAVVKADAYGLGIDRISKTLFHAGCRQFFTATHREGVALRRLLPDADIFVFEGVTGRSARAFLDHGLIPVLITPDQGACWVRCAREAGATLPAVIDIDTGMTRLGMGRRELTELLDRCPDLEGLDVRYVMTHLACADDRDSPMLREQLRRFDRLRALLPDAPTSIGNSAGSLRGDGWAGDMARVGIALFGGNPFLDDAHPGRPVLRIQSRILQLREITEPTPVGYGSTHTAAPGMRIATVGTGYADGYPWSLGNRGVAVVGGQRVPVVGRVSMDLITLDVTGVPDELVQPGCRVDLIGPEISLEEVAQRAGTINYEILTRLGQRAQRRYLGGPDRAAPEDC
jgi:alanine racemase